MTEFYHHGVKGQKWGVTHERPRARQKYVTNNGKGVHGRGRHGSSKAYRTEAQKGSYEKALSQHGVTAHINTGQKTYSKEELTNIMKMNPPPSPNAPGYSQYWYDLTRRPDMLCSTESYENMQDPNAEGQPPYYIHGNAEDGYYDENGNPVDCEVDEEDKKANPLGDPQKIWKILDSRYGKANKVLTDEAHIPKIHRSPTTRQRIMRDVTRTINRCKSHAVSKISRTASGVRFRIMKKVWKRFPNVGVKQIKEIEE